MYQERFDQQKYYSDSILYCSIDIKDQCDLALSLERWFTKEKSVVVLPHYCEKKPHELVNFSQWNRWRKIMENDNISTPQSWSC